MNKITKRQFMSTVGMGSVALVAGCAGSKLNLNVTDNPELMIFTVESFAVPIGYYAAANKNLDTAFRELYSLATKGTLTTEGVNKIITALGTNDPIAVLMIKRCLRLAEMVGATVEGGTLTSIEGLDPRLVQAVADGYVEGYDTYVLTQAKILQKAIMNPSPSAGHYNLEYDSIEIVQNGKKVNIKI
jgi:hypothetical protein